VTARRINYVILLVVVCAASIVYLMFGQSPQLELAVLAFSSGVFVQWIAIGFAALYRAPAPSLTSPHALALWVATAYPFILIDRPEFPSWFVLVSVPAGYGMAFAFTSVADYILRRISRLRV